MEVDDRTVIPDEELQAALERLVAVVDGIVPFHLHCPCGRLYNLAAREEMTTLLSLIKKAMFERTGEEPIADSSRFSLLEVD